MSPASCFRYHTQEASQLNMKWPKLQPLRHEGTHLLHARAIDAQIAIAGAGSGAEVDSLRFVVEEKFNIIDEAK